MKDTDALDTMSDVVSACIETLLFRKGSTIMDLINFMHDEKNEHLINLGMKNPNEVVRMMIEMIRSDRDVMRTKKGVYRRLLGLTMIIALASLKGGVGKSTVTQNLAVCFAHKGYSVCIADVDTNQSCLRWSELRSEGLPEISVSGFVGGVGLKKNVEKLNDKFEIVLIDGTPSLSALTNKVILLSGLLIIPVLSGVMDIWATNQFLEAYNEAVIEKEEEIPACFLLNQYNERYTRKRDKGKYLKIHHLTN